MARLNVIYNDSKARSMRRKLESAMKGTAQSAPIRKAAYTWRDRMIRRTPKRWTGQTRRSWQVNNIRANTYELTNTSKVMLWLERGTKAHGPVTAKRLFIPLTRKAAQAGARGVMYANREHSLNQAFGNTGMKKRPPFIYGKDFVFAKRVRGIKAMWIVRVARADARRTLRIAMREYLLQAISGP